MVEIIPAILPTSFKELQEKAALAAGVVPLVQLDVCDGSFVPSKTWPYNGQEKQALPEIGKLKYEVDLMVSHPTVALVDEWIAAGATKLLFHVESAPAEEIAKLIAHLEELIPCGVAIGLDTPIGFLTPFLEDISGVQFMGIEKVGYQGQEFAGEKALDKIRAFHGAHPEIPITVDGGVHLDNAKAIVEAGASRLIVGSAIIGEKTLTKEKITAALQEFKKIL